MLPQASNAMEVFIESLTHCVGDARDRVIFVCGAVPCLGSNMYALLKLCGAVLWPHLNNCTLLDCDSRVSTSDVQVFLTPF
jgi:hypothetical protein